MNKKRTPQKPKISKEKIAIFKELGVHPYFNRCINCRHWDKKKKRCTLKKTTFNGFPITEYSIWCHEMATEFFLSDNIRIMKIDEVKRLFKSGSRTSVFWYFQRCIKERLQKTKSRKYIGGECDVIAKFDHVICERCTDGCDHLQNVYKGSFTCRHQCIYSRDNAITSHEKPLYCAYDYVNSLDGILSEMRKKAIEVDDVQSWFEYYLLLGKRNRLLGKG